MATPAGTYQTEIHRNLGFYATWLPGDNIAVGDIGVLEDGRLRRVTSLDFLHIPFATKQGDATRDLQYTSTSGTSIVIDAGASISGVAKGQINLNFSSQGAFVFQVHGLRDERLTDLRSVSAGMIDAYNNKRWEPDWVLVESLHTAEIATIVISQDQSASLVLEASTQNPLTSISLADPKVQLSIKSTRGKLVHVVGGKHTRPLYLCVRLKTPLFGAPKVHPARGLADSNKLDAIERPSLEDLLG